jgi:hypothetical protein
MPMNGSFDPRILGVQVTLRPHEFRSSEKGTIELLQWVGAHYFWTSVIAPKSMIDNKIYD